MSIIAIIPALDQNKYSPKGDLTSWGDTNLLEWKISQLRLVDKIDRIVISTDSDKIIKVAERLGIEVFIRNKVMNLTKVISHTCSKLKFDDHILWTNPTFPFMDQYVFSSFIDEYLVQNMPNDGLVTSRIIREYLYNNDGAINFVDRTSIVSRRDLEDIHIVTNAAYIASCGNVEKRERIFGLNPIFFETSWLASLEICKSQDIDMFSSLILKYFQDQL